MGINICGECRWWFPGQGYGYLGRCDNPHESGGTVHIGDVACKKHFEPKEPPNERS